jgi:regulatory protein
VKRLGAAPDEASLHEAALAHLGRYATTQAGLRRVLQRRIDRWVRSQPAGGDADQVKAAREAALRVVSRLAAVGAVDDAAFAASRAARLVRSGHSRCAIVAHLAARGVDRGTIDKIAADDPEMEFAAALKFALRRRIGPFRVRPVREDTADRELAVMARAGFARDTVERVLSMDSGAVEAAQLRLKQGGWDGGL